jgi:short-subunit dehydrogenase
MSRTYQRSIVIGASSGIGAEIARQLAAGGGRVAAVARDGDRLRALATEFPERILTQVHDVREVAAVPDLFRSLCDRLGGLDLVVYAAGVMPAVARDEFDTSKDRAMVETNLTGAMAWLNEAAQRFQGVRAGTIVGIGSVAGDRGRAGQPAYNATKAGLATYLEALRNRLSRHGVTVTTIKPGPTATPMTAHVDQSGMMDVRTAAARILRHASSGGERYLSPVHALIFAVLRHIPSRIFRRLEL